MRILIAEDDFTSRAALAGVLKKEGHEVVATVNGAEALGSDVDVGELIALCLAENDRRLAPYDNRLKRPRFVPFLARLALKFIGPKKKVAA